MFGFTGTTNLRNPKLNMNLSFHKHSARVVLKIHTFGHYLIHGN
jgi:hypothetical protein